MNYLDRPLRTLPQALEDMGLTVLWLDPYDDVAGYRIIKDDLPVGDCVFKDETVATQVAVEIAGALRCA